LDNPVDAADRASIIVATLERQLAKGDEALVGYTGFRRYLKTIGGKRFAIDPDKIEGEKKWVFVLYYAPISTRLRPCSATTSCGCDGGADTFRTAKHCSRPGRSPTSWTRPSAAMCSVAFSPWC